MAKGSVPAIRMVGEPVKPRAASSEWSRTHLFLEPKHLTGPLGGLAEPVPSDRQVRAARDVEQSHFHDRILHLPVHGKVKAVA